MDENSTNDLLLSRYLDNELQPEEKALFEQQLIADPSLGKTVEQLKLAIEAVKYNGTYETVGAVRKTWEQSKAGTNDGVKAKLVTMKSTWRVALLAASILFAFVIIKGLFLNTPGAEQLYSDTFVSYQLDNSRSQAGQVTDLEKSYQQKQYAEVVTMANLPGLSAKDKLLVGISALETGKTLSAISTLEALLQTTDATYHQDTEFYLSLAYLKNKAYAKALPLMKKIYETPTHLYHAQVSEKTIRAVEQLAKKD